MFQDEQDNDVNGDSSTSNQNAAENAEGLSAEQQRIYNLGREAERKQLEAEAAKNKYDQFVQEVSSAKQRIDNLEARVNTPVEEKKPELSFDELCKVYAKNLGLEGEEGEKIIRASAFIANEYIQTNINPLKQENKELRAQVNELRMHSDPSTSQYMRIISEDEDLRSMNIPLADKLKLVKKFYANDTGSSAEPTQPQRVRKNVPNARASNANMNNTPAGEVRITDAIRAEAAEYPGLIDPKVLAQKRREQEERMKSGGFLGHGTTIMPV